MKWVFVYVILLVLSTGCKKIMHEEEISIGKITSYDQLVSATGGVYGSIANILSADDYCYANIKGDDLTGYPASYSEYNHTPCYVNNLFYSFSPNVWSLTYRTITSINNILIQYNNFPFQDKATKQILGELYFLRAYCYFRLTRTYGQVPLITDIEISYTVPKPSFTEIYKFIENDLIVAKSFLPENNNSSRIPYVTPHRGTVKALLAEVYLSWAGYPVIDISKYGLAAKEAGETIDSAGYFGFGLVNDFAYLWDSIHVYNTESVFTVYFRNPSHFTNAADLNNEFYSMTSSINKLYRGMLFKYFGQFKTSSVQPYVQLDFPPTEVEFFNNYPPGYRKEITFFTTIYVPPELVNFVDTGYIHITHISTCSRIGYRKFYYQPYYLYKYYYFGSTKVYLFRFAQTLLTYAEAMARSGQLNAQVYEYVNQIRRRARQLDLNSPSIYDLPTGLSSEAFADSVVQERAWELCGEPEGRWFDLVRLEMVEDLPKLRDPKEGGPPSVFDKSIYYFAIPGNDTLLNPNLGK